MCMSECLVCLHGVRLRLNHTGLITAAEKYIERPFHSKQLLKLLILL